MPAYLLHNQLLNYGWLGRKGATLFPFFDHRGKTKAFMLLVPKRGETWFLDAKPNAFSLKKISDGYTTHEVLTYRGKLPNPGPPDADQLKRFSALYHYDPWWLLNKPTFKHSVWSQALKATNVADLAECANLGFDLSLNRTVKTLNLPEPKSKGQSGRSNWSSTYHWPKWRKLNRRVTWSVESAWK